MSTTYGAYSGCNVKLLCFYSSTPLIDRSHPASTFRRAGGKTLDDAPLKNPDKQN